jgi:BirA family biotin operon repressor/biotin-[acetyl-CoA-carboxylase] ligase
MRENPYKNIESGEPGRIGWRICYYTSLPSTQRKATELVERDEPGGTVVIAERQTAGRGRMGRSWHSPPGVNLYLSVILRPRVASEMLSRISLVAGVAAAEALDSVAPGLVALKWPNDLWLQGKKAGGIIAEIVLDKSNQVAAVVLGIGINVNLDRSQIPPDLSARATSIRIATGRPCDRIALAATLFDHLNRRLSEVEQSGFDSIRLLWERYSALTGKRVTVINGAERLTGIVAGIDTDGALLLDRKCGRERIIAGDVSVEGAYN